MDIRFRIEDIDRIVEETGRNAEALIPVLQAIQDRYKYLPEAALHRVCDITGIRPADIDSVTTFFPQLRRRPAGKYTINVCDGTACHVKGSTSILDSVTRELGISEGEDTDADGMFTVQRVACLGCCTLAPAVQIDKVTYGHVRPDTVPRVLEDFLAHESAGKQHPLRRGAGEAVLGGEIRVGLGSCCVAAGSYRVWQALEESLSDVRRNVHLKRVGCVGMCFQTPLLEVIVAGKAPQFYAKVQPEDIPEIVTRHFMPRNRLARIGNAMGKWLDRLYIGNDSSVLERHAFDVRDKPVAAFLDKQQRLATEYCGELEPTDIDEYVRWNGFEALRKCLGQHEDSSQTEMPPEDIISEITNSGLRGRGGAGFPTGRKWAAVHAAPGGTKYVICNGDEGDPGAFMDRMTLESYPYRVIEGMIIASIAIGAREGLLYIRAEYPLATTRIKKAIQICEKAGWLGENILGSAHTFRLKVVAGAGAFVCGEETALIASIEGRRGSPSFRPPYPAEQGLYGCPTLVNNTETFALVPWIMRHGAKSFSSLGTQRSKGTKVFSLAGKIRRGGLIEVPMGVTIRQIVEEIGGGVPDGATFKAVQAGGPSGGCIPAALADTPVDYESLAEAGSMMGSGGLVVLDSTDCMVEMTRYFLSFTQQESCGKCTPCRVGTKKMLDILSRLCDGKGKAGDIDQLAHLAEFVKEHSLCGLGRTAPNPVLTTLRYFRDEYDAHVEGRCPAGKCPGLITYSITSDCIGCTKCAQECPVGAIDMTPYEQHAIDTELCIRCGGCYQICPVKAVKVE